MVHKWYMVHEQIVIFLFCSLCRMVSGFLPFLGRLGGAYFFSVAAATLLPIEQLPLNCAPGSTTRIFVCTSP